MDNLFKAASIFGMIAATFAVTNIPARAGTPTLPVPLARWTFEDGTPKDDMGVMDGFLENGATISNGRLVLNGTDAYMQTGATPVDISEKTLSVWVTVEPLTQGGGGTITLQTSDGIAFDSITYAERQPKKWIAGSQNWWRTADLDAPPEVPGLVHMVAVYAADNSITLYRNGQIYGASYTPNASYPLVVYPAGSSQVLLGMRLGTAAGDNRMLKGRIEEAALFDRALSPEEVQLLYASFIPPDPRIDLSPLAVGAKTGETATLSVIASGTAPLTYQWLKDGQPVPGATETNLTFANLQLINAGSYSVIVSNALGHVTSEVALVTVVPNGNGPLAHWTFDIDASDSLGNMNGELMGGAYVDNGHLILNGSDAFVKTGPLPIPVSAKTLVAHVSVSPLDQQAGGVLTLEDSGGIVFDSIVYAERQPDIWMAGSDNWSRTQDVAGSAETEDGSLVWIAIVYKADNSITLYRNGQPYGSPYTPGNPLVTYAAGNGQVVMGLRHGVAATAGKMLTGEIDEAMLYDRALSAEEVAALTGEAIPSLQAVRSGQTLTISWPAALGDFVLESSDLLPAAQWSVVNGATGGQVSVNLDGVQKFFRLRKP